MNQTVKIRVVFCSFKQCNRSSSLYCTHLLLKFAKENLLQRLDALNISNITGSTNRTHILSLPILSLPFAIQSVQERTVINRTTNIAPPVVSAAPALKYLNIVSDYDRHRNELYNFSHITLMLQNQYWNNTEPDASRTTSLFRVFYGN